MREPIVIVGAGQAAAQAVASLRSDGFAGDIVLFGDEPHLPYQRPPLSKAFLAGDTTASRLELKPETFYAEERVDLRLGQRVVRIDPVAQSVTTADDRATGYSKLLIATGTRPRALPLPGDGLAGVHHIRAIRDVERFRAEFAPGAKLVVIGGGYIGLEVAAKARVLSLDVTVIEGQARILSRVVSDETAGFLDGLHRARGVDLRTGAGVRAICGADRATGVELTNGEIVPADIVLIAVGATPNAELAAEAGLTVENGIAVDAATHTSAPNIYAAGDVTFFPSRLYGRRIRLESVPNAIGQAKAAASAMLGNVVDYDPVPWFWSDQYDIKLQIAGLSQGYDRTECEGDREASRFCVRYFAGDRLLAVDSINDPRSHMGARRSLAPENAG